MGTIESVESIEVTDFNSKSINSTDFNWAHESIESIGFNCRSQLGPFDSIESVESIDFNQNQFAQLIQLIQLISIGVQLGPIPSPGIGPNWTPIEDWELEQIWSLLKSIEINSIS